MRFWYNKYMTERIFSFPPVYDVSARLLILGTMPSVKSLCAMFYYAHPRNCFWQMMAELHNASFPKTIEQKKSLLLCNGIAIWDVVNSCERKGSLDSAIVAPVPNDITWLLCEAPGIRTILLNGGTAAKLFNKLVTGVDPKVERFVMPSTSPAYTIPYESKKRIWAMHIPH